jgi:hypothetical protein
VAKTKSVGGTEYPASDFAYVGDPEDVTTWHLPIFDADHVRAALARFNQTELPADAKAEVARKLVAAAKKHGIDASGFADEHSAMMKTSQAADASFEELQQRLNQALVEKFGYDANGSQRYWACETFPDYIIARVSSGDLYQISYSVDGEASTFGEPQQVETAYVPVEQAARFLASEAAAGDGWTWPVQILEAGWAQGSVDGEAVPHYFPTGVVAQVAQAANGGRFRRRHPRRDGSEGDGADSPELTAGWTSEAKMAGNAAVAKLNLLKSEADLREKLMAAREAGKLDLYGVSIFAYFGFRPGVQDGKQALIATQLGKYIGLDLCAEAGAGGKILAYAASRDVLAEISALQKQAIKTVSPGSTRRENGGVPIPSGPTGRIQGGAMKESIMKVLEALRKIDAGRATELQAKFEGLPAEKHLEFFAEVSEAVSKGLPELLVNDPAKGRSVSDQLADAAKQALLAQNAEVMAKAQEALGEAKKVQFASTLERKLTDSKLPVPAASLVREHFAGMTGDEKGIDAYIAKVRESFAAFANVGKLGLGGTVEVGRDTRDKVQAAMDAMFGVKEAAGDRNVRAFRGIKEAYIVCTGDRDISFDRGGFYRVSEAIVAADFPNILLNSMTKKLIQDYNELAIADALNVLYTRATIGDFKTQDRVRMGYLSDLSTVAEAGVYTEMTKPTDEKISYAVSKKGNLVTISEETIRNDDLRKVTEFPGRMARAARHTLAAAITTPFITPPNYDPDGLAWFHATHNNLGATALSSAELDARKIILYKQSEKDSLNRLGLRLWGIMVPADLEPTARQINNNQTGTNSWYQMFGADGERIVVNPLLTDVTDWYYYCDPTIAPFLEVGFLDGFDTPQIFLANLPTQGTQFTNDQLQYKVKFVFGVKPIDFRGVGKEVVAG